MPLIHKLTSLLALISIGAGAAAPQTHATRTAAVAAAQPFAIAAKIRLTKFARLELRIFCDRSGQTAFIERDSRQHSDFHFLAERE